eukprot:10225949-Alexandrium_andersonii.AAC.1
MRKGVGAPVDSASVSTSMRVFPLPTSDSRTECGDMKIDEPPGAWGSIVRLADGGVEAKGGPSAL